MASVKTETRPVEPADLRAFCARHRVPYAEIARRLDCSGEYVGQVMRADRTGKAVSDEKLAEVKRVAQDILYERDAS
jgi:hypothetical protein